MSFLGSSSSTTMDDRIVTIFNTFANDVWVLVLYKATIKG